VGDKMGRLQGRLDTSVPYEDYKGIQNELECLREDHLITLRMEVEVRVASLTYLEQANDNRMLRLKVAHLEANITGNEVGITSLKNEIHHQKDITQRMLNSVQSTDLSSVVSEMARFRGEASRLEIEVIASNKRYELVEKHMKLVTLEAESLSLRITELQEREENSNSLQSEARKEALMIRGKFEGGLTGAESMVLKTRLETSRKELVEVHRDVDRYKELSEIASLQAQTIVSFKQEHTDELNDLKEYVIKLESRGDDELLIGKLQRQLMSTKTSYKLFVRKYQFLRSDTRKKELALKILETRLDEREAMIWSISDTHRIEIASLKKALRVVNDTVEDNSVTNDKSIRNSVRKRDGFFTIGDKLLSMSEKVNTLAQLAEKAMMKATTAEEESQIFQGNAEDLSVEKELLIQKCLDLETIYKNPNKQSQIASRLLSLSEDIRINKLKTLSQRREIQILRQEKIHLKNIISKIEIDVEDLEEGKVEAETKNLLIDFPSEKASGSEYGFSGKGQGPSLDTVRNGGSHGVGRNSRPIDKDLSVDDSRGPSDSDGDDGYNDIKDNKKTYKKSNLIISTDKIPPDEYMEKIKILNQELSGNRREMSEIHLKYGKIQSKLSECESALKEMEGHVMYYEGIMSKEGLPNIKGNKLYTNVSTKNTTQNQNMNREEQEKIQQAASATIHSMQQLINEKNKLIEKYREKLEDKLNIRPKSAIDKRYICMNIHICIYT
jgi:hypothetical protein